MPQHPTFIYHINQEEIPIHGFIASLLLQGEQWDYCAVEADMNDYHAAQYARIDQTVALQRELCWWADIENDPRLLSLPQRAILLAEGIAYLFWRVQEQVLPRADIDKLNTTMTIRIDSEQYLIKHGDDLCLSTNTDIFPEKVFLHGFTAQLLTYAACTTIENQLSQQDINNPQQWVDTMIGWVDFTPQIFLRNIQFDIPDVYALYDTYLANAKAQWQADNRKRYTTRQPLQRAFLKRLLNESQEFRKKALTDLFPYLTDVQMQRYTHYLCEWETYITNQIKTDDKTPKNNLNNFLTDFGKKIPRYQITRRLDNAAKQPHHPTAHLVKEVKKMQEQHILIADLHPMTEFVALLNLLLGIQIKYDSFVKHFSRKVAKSGKSQKR